MEERNFNRTRYLLIASIIIFGTGSSIFTKLLNIQKFYFPLFQLVIMFIGESMSSLLLLYKKLAQSKNKEAQSVLLQSQSAKPRFFSRSGKVIYSIIAIIDLLNTIFENYCLNMMNPTDFLSLKMVGNYYIVFYRIFILKSKIYRHRLVGFAIFTLGILLVVIENIIISTTSERSDYGIYIGLMFVAEFLLAVHFLLIEYYSWKNNACAEEICTIKGITGIVLCGVAYYPLVMIFGYNSYIQDIKGPFEELFSSESLGIISIFLIIDLSIYNWLLMYYIRYTEALATYSMDSGRIVTVSIIFAFTIQEELIAFKIVGGCFIFIGLMIYNEVLILPIFGLNKSAKASINENKIMKMRRAEKMIWIHKLDELVIMQKST